jgi:pimeloyl-ACP methyl ester carboxylesterase
MQLNSNNIFYKNFNNHKENLPHIIWAHGWGQNHEILLPLANSFTNFTNNWLIDLPGFGNSKQPDSIWGSQEYTNAIADWISNHLPPNSIKIWVGHSFGGKIGINLAAQYPKLINGLFLIAASGIPKPRSLTEKIIVYSKIKMFKLFKHFKYANKFKHKFGSPDYKNANPHMRSILVKIIHENLSNLATQIVCQTELIYGEKDQDTPILIGQKLNKLINNSKLHIITKQDHYTILTNAQHQIVYLLKKFIDNIKLLC